MNWKIVYAFQLISHCLQKIWTNRNRNLDSLYRCKRRKCVKFSSSMLNIVHKKNSIVLLRKLDTHMIRKTRVRIDFRKSQRMTLRIRRWCNWMCGMCCFIYTSVSKWQSDTILLLIELSNCVLLGAPDTLNFSTILGKNYIFHELNKVWTTFISKLIIIKRYSEFHQQICNKVRKYSNHTMTFYFILLRNSA